MDPRLDGYDWAEAFAFAGGGGYGDPDVRRAHPTETAVSLATFTREDVVHIEAIDAGENDEADWLCMGSLRDGRWFLLSAGCNYTGWESQAGGTATVAADRTELLAYGITDDQRQRLGMRGSRRDVG